MRGCVGKYHFSSQASRIVSHTKVVAALRTVACRYSSVCKRIHLHYWSVQIRRERYLVSPTMDTRDINSIRNFVATHQERPVQIQLASTCHDRA